MCSSGTGDEGGQATSGTAVDVRSKSPSKATSDAAIAAVKSASNAPAAEGAATEDGMPTADHAADSTGEEEEHEEVEEEMEEAEFEEEEIHRQQSATAAQEPTEAAAEETVVTEQAVEEPSGADLLLLDDLDVDIEDKLEDDELIGPDVDEVYLC